MKVGDVQFVAMADFKLAGLREEIGKQRKA
jgi:hypothetical protein